MDKGSTSVPNLIKNVMKKLLLCAGFLVTSILAIAQGLGLEDIIVEKYYVSDANDATANDGGVLPSGSITYRIWVDMAPGYKLRSVFSDPDYAHDLRIKTTTTFFNNIYAGETTPNAIADIDLNKNTVMLDSWISLGGASAGNIAVFKDDDNNGANTNVDGFLQNTDPRAGVPIKTKDGLVSGSPVTISKIGLDQALSVFDNVNGGPQFYVTNGLWYNTEGVAGITNENRVLIAQITTDGILSYNLNFLIFNISTNKTERYVHANADPDAGEIPCEKCSSPGVPTAIDKLRTGTDSGLQSGIKVFPNPVKEIIHIQFGAYVSSNIYSVAIFDIIGRQVFQIEGFSTSESGVLDINTSSLPKGLYIIKLSSDVGLNLTKRFIKN